MNYNITKVAIFLAGAAVGSVVTWKIVKTKYEQIAQEEIDSVKAVFSKNHEETEEDQGEEKPASDISNPIADKPNIAEYVSTVEKTGYDTFSKQKKEKTKEEEANYMKDGPYVISPEEFGELDNYETISLTYYDGDGFLADDMDELVDDVDSTVGWDSLESFGEYEDDAVHVRNDKRKCDYEILRDLRKYSDVAPVLD